LKTTLTVSKFLEIFNCSLAGLSGLTSVVISLQKLGALPSLLEEFRHMDDRFLLTPPQSNRNVLIYSIVHWLIVISIYTTAVVLMCWKNNEVIAVALTICLTLAQMYLIIAEMQFVCLCCALKERYKHINNCINKLYNSKFAYTNGLNNVSTPKSQNGHEICFTLRKLRKSHRCLYDIGKKLNRIYDGQLFVSVFTCFTLTIFCCYYGIMYYGSHEYIPIGMFVSGVHYFVRFFIINYCCQTTTEEVRLFAKTTQFLMTRYY
jgi:hypothetical protein